MQDAQSIIDQFAQVASSIAVPCSLMIDAAPDPDSLLVELDSQTIEADATDGWVLQGAQLTLHGSACERYRSSSAHVVELSASCEPLAGD